MAKEIVEALGIKREKGFLYFVRGTSVWKAPLKRGGGPSAAGRDEKVVDGKFAREPGFLYFLDRTGHVARVVQKVGGARS